MPNIHTLFNFEPPATDDEVWDAVNQFVRKISGFSKPSQANEQAFARAVDEVAERPGVWSTSWSPPPRRRTARSRRSVPGRESRSASPPLSLVLYDSPVSGNCYKVRLLLAHLGIPYERRTWTSSTARTVRDLLGGLNPALRVPTLVLDDGRPLAESNAILWYLGEGTRFVPAIRTSAPRCCSGCSSSSTTTSRRSRSRASGSRTGAAGGVRGPARGADGGRAPALAAMERHLDGRDSSSATAYARRHRALRVHARRARGRLRARARTPRSAAGSSEWRPSPGTPRSRPRRR